MKTIFFVALIFSALAMNLVKAQNAEDKKLIILHTNDMHSRLNGFPPETEYTPLSTNDDNTKGGFARIAALIREEKEKLPGKVLVLDAGDFLMGTFFTRLEESTGFQLSLMKEMGYDIVSLGNHEFDYGPRVLADIIGKSASNGGVPLMVASNLSFSEMDSEDDAMKSLFDQKIIQPYRIIEKNGLRLGIFGLLGYSAISNAPLARPVIFEDPVKTARNLSRFLKEKEKADLVICISHSGIRKDKDGNWTGEDVKLAMKAPAIDVIIGGHSHTLLQEPVIINGIPIVQAGCYGTGLGRLELDISQKKISHIEGKVIPVNDAIPGVPEIQRKITQQEKMVSDRILKPLSLSYSTVVTETSFPLIYQEDTMLEKSNLGPLISDAIYSYVNKHNPPGADVTLFPAGLIFDNIIPAKTGKQAVADIFRVVPMGSGKDDMAGYPLARIWVTGKELKGIMEILYLAPSSSKDNYIYFGGLKATYNPKKGLLNKITSIETGNPEKGFTPVDFSKKNKKLYGITANSYVLEFVGLIKKLSMHLIKVSLKNEKGEIIKSVDDAIIDSDPVTPGVQEVKEWMTLLWFLQQQPDLNGNGIPDVPPMYRTVTPRLYQGAD